jgi:uncharacterized repeat protein (TIGR03843 family)
MDPATKSTILTTLQNGKMEIEGLLPWSSNYAFLVTICDEKQELRAVYKPRRGERPLWDFPEGTLSLREQAAFLVSDWLGWDLVPPTVLRRGEHGLGSVQLFVEHDPDQHYFAIEGDPLFKHPLQRMALLDVAINNADRKGGHVLIEQGSGEEAIGPGHLWGIDHGICFNAEFKLRTVIWEFAGLPIPDEYLAELIDLNRALLEANQDSLVGALGTLLSVEEVAAMRRRVQALVEGGLFPSPGSGRHYPWPPV